MGPSIILFALATAALGAVIPRNAPTTVTVTAPCQGGSATAIPSLAASAQSFAASSTASAVSATSSSGGTIMLGPVSNPSRDPSDLSNIVPKSNLTLFYGSNDTSTPASNAQISVQMKMPSVILEDILSVKSVVCSDTGVLVTFNDEAGYEKSMKEWPASGDFVLFTNHLGNCDAEFERGMFLVGGLVFDESTLTVDTKAEKSDFQSTAGSMQIDFGQILGSAPKNSTAGPYSNTTTKRDIHWDPTYSLNFDKSLPPNTNIASLDPYLSVTANTASFTSSATFSGHVDYNFWLVKVESLYVDLNVAFDANLALSSSIQAGYSNTFSYAPSSLALAPISISGVLTLGPALDFAVGAQVGADADVKITTQTEVNLQDGNVHVDLLDGGNTGASGWTPTSSASASLDVEASVEVNPYVTLGVELAVDFMDGLLDLSSGIKANATLANTLTGTAGASAKTSTGVSARSGQVNGACQNGLEFKSDFIFAITGFVTSFYSKQIYGVEVPLFDKCWSLGSS